MNPAESIFSSDDGGKIIDRLNEYIHACRQSKPEEDDYEKKKKASERSAFPNLAGFCRFLGIGASELEDFGSRSPDIYGRILAILEDEALNSALSPTLVSAYLKKRLGYDGTEKRASSQLEISFEHDVFEDGG